MVNPYTATVQEIQTALGKGLTSSVQLVEQCLEQIEAHNLKGRSLHAIISVPPHDKVTAVAAALDNERKQGSVRGPLHGIPFIVKVFNHLLSSLHVTYRIRTTS